jgi:hypothetical protein
MPFTLNCGCGKILRIADEHAGKRVKCPACNAVLTSVPPPPAFEVVEDEPKQLATAKPAAKARVDDDDDNEAYGVKKAERTPDPPPTKPSFRRRGNDDDDDDPRPRRRRSSARQAGAMAGADAGKRLGYMVGGTMLAIIGAVLTYFAWAQEWRTRSLILGIALVIGGLITFIQGFTGNMPDED